MASIGPVTYGKMHGCEDRMHVERRSGPKPECFPSATHVTDQGVHNLRDWCIDPKVER